MTESEDILLRSGGSIARHGVLFLLCLLLGCDGVITGGPRGPAGTDGVGDPAGAGSAPVEFSCDPSAQPAPAPPLRRLTDRQYRNSLRDWLTRLVGESEADQLMSGLLQRLPRDQRFVSPRDLKGSLRRLDQAVADPHVSVWYETGTRLGAELTNEARLGRVFGSCAVDADPSNDASCAESFVRQQGARLLRMPLDGEQVSLYAGFYGETGGTTDPRGFADVIAALLNAPQFLYVVAHGQQPTGPAQGAVELTAFELAARLSLHFWESLPDDELWAAAADGSLLEAGTYEAQVERLASAPRTRHTVREFYRDWLKLEDLPELDQNNEFPRFRAFAGDDLPGPELREHMIDEVLDMLDYHTWQDDRGVEPLLLSSASFARTQDLAALYGVPTWDGEWQPPEFQHDERVGLLGRAALLSTGTANTRPIMKGVFIRRTLLCDEIPPPPDNAAADPPELSEELTTREVVEELTEVEGTSCPACHQTLINPLGFPTESFDALGRFRVEQALLDQQGEVVTTLPVDTRSAPLVVPGDTREVEAAPGLARQILESGKFEACMARNYFRFAMGRFEDLNADACTLESLRTALTQSGSMQQMLRAVAMNDAFKRRSFTE